MKRPELFRALLVAMLAMWTGACAWMQPATEHRYRLFDPDDSPFAGQAATDSDSVAQRFGETARLNRSLDEIGQEGFVYTGMRLAPWGVDEIEMSFERKLESRKRPTTAPMEMAGVYRVLDDAELPTFYALSPIKWGYQIHRIHGEAYESHLAWWDGRQLNWQDGNLYHRLTLDGDALGIHIEVDDVMPGQPRPVQWTVEALRLRPRIAIAGE